MNPETDSLYGAHKPSVVGWLLVGLCVLAGCGTPREHDAAPGKPADSETTLQIVSLPNLDGEDESIVRHIEAAWTDLEKAETAAASKKQNEAALAQAYGILGQRLLAYTYLAAAEPALRNAHRLAPENARWAYYLGYLYQTDEQLEQAATYYEQTLALDPAYLPTYLRLAETYRDLGQTEPARQTARRAIERDPTNAMAHYVLGQVADDPAEAVEHFEQALQLQPSATRVHYPLGMAYRRLGNTQRSQEHIAQRGDGTFLIDDALLQDVEAERQGTEALLGQAVRLMDNQNYAEAVPLLEHVVATNPRHVIATHNLGVAYYELNRREDALAMLDRVLNLDPGHAKAHLMLGVIHEERGELDRALAYYRIAAESVDNAQALYQAAGILWRQGRCAESISYLEQFLTLYPTRIEARLRLAMCLVQMGDEARARSSLEAGLAAAPNHPALQDALVRVLSASQDANVRDGERALSLAQALVQTARRPETLASLAMAQAEAQRFREAVTHQQEALEQARQHGQTALLPSLEANLRRYEAGQPCREPWPPQAYPSASKEG